MYKVGAEPLKLLASTSHHSMDALHFPHLSGLVVHRWPPESEALGTFAGHPNNYLPHKATVCGEKPSFLHHEIKLSGGSCTYPPLQLCLNLLQSHSPIFPHCTSSCCAGLSHFSTIHYQLSLICPVRQAYPSNTQTARSEIYRELNRIQHGQMNDSCTLCNSKPTNFHFSLKNGHNVLFTSFSLKVQNIISI